jgi:hypothetical protein
MTLNEIIGSAFEQRTKPRNVVPRWYPTTNEYEEARQYNGKDWRELDAAFLKKNSDAIYAFTPEAFCYYLPAYLIAGMGRGQDATFLAGLVVGMLDRSPNPDFWDEFFLTRWCALREQECLAVQEWLVYLSESAEGRDADDLSRSFDTMQLLAQRVKGHGSKDQLQ